MEWRSPRRDEVDRRAIEMLDGPRNKRQRQLRRLRHERVRREIDRGADSAIIVAVVAGLLCGKLWRLRARAGERCRMGSTMHAVKMEVPERQDELQRQRGKRQGTANPPNIPNPPHPANSSPTS